MGFQEFLNHRCDIYHVRRTDTSPGYSLPASPAFSYPDTPDEPGVPCHFGLRNGTERIIQNQPNASLETRIKLSLPIGTDIRLNDKIVNCDSGYEFTAEIPHDIQGHHLIVWLHRTDRQEPL